MHKILFLLLSAVLPSLRDRAALQLELIALRHQLLVLERKRTTRPRLTRIDRFFWVWLYRLWPGCLDVVVMVKPDTVIRWHRRGFRLFWRWKSRPRRRGRPPVPTEVRDLIRRMSQENPLWGTPRSHGELLMLGIEISQATVSNYMARRGRPPSQTWRTFLANYADGLASIDLFVVPTTTFRLLYAVIVLRHERRKVVHFNVTTHPTANWLAQQLVEAFPWETAPRYLIRDRDAAYGTIFRDRLETMSIVDLPTAPRSPWQNAYVERVIGSIRRECLDHVIVLNARHLRRILSSYFDYYHRSRTHLSLAKDYIASQSGEGWRLIGKRYDDGAYSGATMERPALQRLLADIDAGKIDTVVVHKVDRLTRSLIDFARIVELFDAHKVSFVSITQQFNTTTSMGRLTLNMLLSFAQFEREVTGERIRDKIAASKRKGMWMGGVVPLGYDAIDRKLIINEAEAETVRTLFRLYLDHANVRLVKQDADRLGLTTKSRRPDKDRRPGGKPFTRSHIYKLLANPVYVGEIVHRGVHHAGEHEAIIDRETWDAVQEQLGRNAIDRRCGSNTKIPSLLAGLLFDEDGDRLRPSHANNHGRRYRYYVSKLPTEKASDAGAGWRLPAREIETVVLNGIGDLLRDRIRLIEYLKPSDASPDRLKTLLLKAADLSDRITDSGPTEQRRILLAIVDRIEVSPALIGIVVRRDALHATTGEGVQDEEHRRRNGHLEGTFRLDLPVSLKRRGAGMKLVITDDRHAPPAPDSKLITAIAQGRAWFAEITDGGAGSISELAQRHGVDRTDVGRMILFALLAPDIVQAILEGRQPVDLTAARLRRVRDLPDSWSEQRKFLGFER